MAATLAPAVELAAGVSVVLGAGAMVWRLLRLGELLRGTRAFLVDWQGEPARPGRQRTLSVPERLQLVEEGVDTATGQLSGVGHALSRLQERADTNLRKIEDNAQQLLRLDRRVSRLEVDVERRLDATLLRSETYRASLIELGIDVEPPPAPPPAFREDDEP